MSLKQTFYFEGFPRPPAAGNSWQLHLRGMLRGDLTMEGRLRVDGHYISQGSVVFSLPPDPQKAPSK